MKSPVKAAGHRIVVEVDIPEYIKKFLEAGLELPREIKERHTTGFDTGVVVDIGENAFKAFDDGRAWVNLGDKVMIVKYSGQSFNHEGKTFRIINDEDIYGIVVDDKFNVEVKR